MKRMFLKLLVTLVWLTSTIGIVSAQTPAAPVAEDPAHQELRAIKDAMVNAFNQKDTDAFMKHVHPNVVVTWQNAEVARHPEGIKAFWKKMGEGDSKVVESTKATVNVDELTSLYGDTGVAFGSLDQDFKFTDGKEFKLPNRWTATFVKQDGHWLLAAFHVSANVFENPMLSLVLRKTASWVGGISLVLGLALGWFVARRCKQA